MLSTGDAAIDFTLPTVDGKLVSLSKLLEEKPVVFFWGMHTCPAFEGLGDSYPFDQCSYQYEWDLVEEYKDSFNFVHFVGPEPHPQSPEVNFDSGKIKTNFWSTMTQTNDWQSRLQAAEKISSKVHPDAHLVVDPLADDPYGIGMNNPAWCTYFNGARGTMIVDQDGVIQDQRTWFRSDNLITAMKKVLKKNS
jgi:peroxiredoxin